MAVSIVMDISFHVGMICLVLADTGTWRHLGSGLVPVLCERKSNKQLKDIQPATSCLSKSIIRVGGQIQSSPKIDGTAGGLWAQENNVHVILIHWILLE